MRGPVLVCAGSAPDLAGPLGRRVAALTEPGRAVVLAVWNVPMPIDPFGAVTDAWYGARDQLAAEARRGPTDAAAAAAQELAAAGWEVEERVVEDPRRPWQVALDVADELDAALVVAGSTERPGHHHGSLGGEARALAHRARRPLLVVPPGEDPASDAPALFGFDGSDPATRALTEAAALLRRRSATVVMVWHSILGAAAMSLAGAPAGLMQAGGERLDEIAAATGVSLAADGAALLERAGWTATPEPLRATGSVWPVLVDAAGAAGAAVIVIGARGRSPIAAALLGGDAEGVLRHAARPVLMVPASAHG